MNRRFHAVVAAVLATAGRGTETTPPAFRSVTATVTAYCPCTTCCGPGSPKPTASGARPVAGVTVAAPRHLPFGTRLWIEGAGWRTVQDRMSRRFPDRFDLFFDHHQQALHWGRRTCRVVLPSIPDHPTPHR